MKYMVMYIHYKKNITITTENYLVFFFFWKSPSLVPWSFVVQDFFSSNEQISG